MTILKVFSSLDLHAADDPLIGALPFG